MNQKVFHTLEYDKILEMLAQYAASEETKKRIHALVPLTDMEEINYLQQTTADALSRLYKSGAIGFTGIHNLNASQEAGNRRFLKYHGASFCWLFT